MKKLLLLAAFWLFSGLANAAITAQQAYVREMPPGQPVTAAFMQLQNNGAEAVVLVGAVTDSAERVEIHAHRHNNGMMRMEQVDSITVPAAGEFSFKPGAYHLMLINITRPLAEGDTVRLKLEFTNAEPIFIDLPVQNIMREHNHH